jgi:hypothetical protein
MPQTLHFGGAGGCSISLWRRGFIRIFLPHLSHRHLDFLSNCGHTSFAEAFYDKNDEADDTNDGLDSLFKTNFV